MEPIAPLMVEHRLIERMLQLIRKEAQVAEEKRQIDVILIDAAVDFIRWYADRTHHGKEEAILFRDVGKKNMSPKDRGLMLELIEDHDFGRRTVSQLNEAKEAYLQGHAGSMETILDKCQRLITFYQGHIDKEDNQFFPASMKYLNKEEQEAMLEEFWESDRKMIHLKYGAVIDRYENRKS